MIDDAEFAKRVRACRAYLDWTLAEAGDALGLSPSQLSKREHADTNGLRFRPADRLYMATVYSEQSGWPLEFFTGGRREEPEDLSPAEVVELVEGREGDDGAEAGRG